MGPEQTTVNEGNIVSKPKALTAAEAQIAALNARLEIARTVYVNQKARIAELEAALNTRGVKPAVVEPKVTHYTDRAGRVWEKTRVGQPSNVAPR